MLLVMCPICLTCWLPSPGAHTRASAWQAQCPRMSNLTQTWCMAVLSSAKAASGRGEWGVGECRGPQGAAWGGGHPRAEDMKLGPLPSAYFPFLAWLTLAGNELGERQRAGVVSGLQSTLLHGLLRAWTGRNSSGSRSQDSLWLRAGQGRS